MTETKDKPEFDAAQWLEMMPLFLSGSDDQMAPWVREKVRAVVERPHKPSELYDVLAEVAAIPVTVIDKGPPRLLMGDISGFVQAFCDVKSHYRRPTP